MAVFQRLSLKGWMTAGAGAGSMLFPAMMALAQSTDDLPLPASQGPSAVESYSLPPGTDPAPERRVQGPVDAETSLPDPVAADPPVARTRVPVAVEETGREPAPEPDIISPAIGAAPAQQRDGQARQSPESGSSTGPSSQPATSRAIPQTPQDSVPEQPSRPASAIAPKADVSPPPVSGTTRATAPDATTGWLLPGMALLLCLLAGLTYWRKRETSPDRAAVAVRPPPKIHVRNTKPVAAKPEKPAIALDFQPRSAGATLINAVIGFELQLCNRKKEMLREIRISGNMVQAAETSGGSETPEKMVLLHELSALAAGETKSGTAELRVPLAAIRPIIFRSQALFIPQVHISITYIDTAGTRQEHRFSYLIGQEHQPPRSKMAPFRLDLGPRSFAPIGHRPLAAP